MSPGARGKMRAHRVGFGGAGGRGPEVLGGRRSAVRPNIIGNIRRGSENIITNIRRVLGGSAGGLGGQRSAVWRSGPGGGVRIGGSPYTNDQNGLQKTVDSVHKVCHTLPLFSLLFPLCHLDIFR